MNSKILLCELTAVDPHPFLHPYFVQHTTLNSCKSEELFYLHFFYPSFVQPVEYRVIFLSPSSENRPTCSPSELSSKYLCL